MWRERRAVMLNPVANGGGVLARSSRAALVASKDDVQRAVPQHVLAERAQLIESLEDRQEVVPGELADDRREQRPAVGEEDLGLAQPARVPEHLPGRRMRGGVLGFAVEADVELAERDPGR